MSRGNADLMELGLSVQDKNTHPVRLSLVEDDDAIRQYLVDSFGGDARFCVCDAASNLHDGLLALQRERPDILLVDIGLPDGSGIELIQAVRELRLDTMALVISGFHDEHTVFAALQAGAQGYILKHDRNQKIVELVLQMMGGGSPISPVIARMVLATFDQSRVDDLPEHLTERQLEILRYVSQGFTSKEIGEKLGLSYHTVATHVKNIYAKLQVNSRTEAIYEASKLGLLTKQ